MCAVTAGAFETKMALLERDISDLRDQERENAARIADLEAQDKNRMRWAIGALGTVAMGLALYIWNFKVDGK